MQALFIGQTYIDVTFLTDRMPAGDEKHVASAYAVSFGGNAVTAAFCCAKLSIVPDLLATVADDWLGRMFLDMAWQYRIPVHPRKVANSSLSFIMPNDGKRAIVRCRDDDYLHSYPALDLTGCRALHVDGHQPDAAIHYARLCRSRGILTSLDGGGLRSNTHELLAFIDVAMVAERLCEQMQLTPSQMLGRATCFTAPTSIPIWRIRRGDGRSISASRRQPPRTRFNTSATRRACPRSMMCTRWSGSLR